MRPRALHQLLCAERRGALAIGLALNPARGRAPIGTWDSRMAVFMAVGADNGHLITPFPLLAMGPVAVNAVSIVEPRPDFCIYTPSPQHP
jgi:hypothetical protein